MSIGLCGAQGTGKTTLAEAYSVSGELTFVRSDVAGVFAKLGLDPKADYPFDVRMDIQEEILKHLDEIFSDAESESIYFITDRTPIDLMAYTLADIKRERMTDEQEARLDRYLKACIFCTNRHFSTLVAVQPGIKRVEREGRAPMGAGYQEHINALIMGVLVSEDVHPSHYYIPRDKTALVDRLKCVEFAEEKTAEKHEKLILSAHASGSPIIYN